MSWVLDRALESFRRKPDGLERYRDRILSFNDDIQGTGATALAALMTAMRIKGESFKDQRFVIVGLGQAGTGVGLNIRAQLKEEGLDEEEIRARIFAVEQQGLVVEGDPKLEGPNPAGLPVQQLVHFPRHGPGCLGFQGHENN